jgi:hypothetical protein
MLRSQRPHLEYMKRKDLPRPTQPSEHYEVYDLIRFTGARSESTAVNIVDMGHPYRNSPNVIGPSTHFRHEDHMHPSHSHLSHLLRQTILQSKPCPDRPQSRR